MGPRSPGLPPFGKRSAGRVNQPGSVSVSVSFTVVPHRSPTATGAAYARVTDSGERWPAVLASVSGAGARESAIGRRGALIRSHPPGGITESLLVSGLILVSLPRAWPLMLS